MSYIILSGGVIIWPIILLSIISLAIVFEKTWNLARDIILPKNLRENLIFQISENVISEKKIKKNVKRLGPWKYFCKLTE